MNLSLKMLKAVAEKSARLASPNWRSEGPLHIVDEFDNPVAHTNQSSDTDFIVTFSPAAALELIARVELSGGALRAVMKQLDGDLRDKDWMETERLVRSVFSSITSGDEE